jgi:thiol-disulfide isomerase/thioredoxin
VPGYFIAQDAKTFLSKLAEAKKAGPVAVLYTASWCSACKSMVPDLKKLGAKATVIQIDFEKHGAALAALKHTVDVPAYPVIALYVKGKLKEEIEGATDYADLSGVLGVK